ncbi:peptidoglycan editing factor PgeF [Marinisporobacter balticus]|uniref:Purine nucleoside phosphorylase n=1 Tax=Marinisporobacter balticus TaxID=2018667 RepID=A0A4V2SCG7_9FIRM|nr:peptidoglycan editing factor PgeF [Marinisporobacter balticus]TCO79290.1 hypothetical protein EV214_1028 [Marinisporobacter balticus]
MNYFKEHTGKNGVVYFSVPSFDETGMAKNCFTSRIGGVSTGEYSALNLGLKTEDKEENIIENYRRICEALEISTNDLVCSDQIHKDYIKIVTKEDCGKGIMRDRGIVGIDALITNVPKVALATVYADCVPIFLLDPKHKVIALAHAGWRGTVLKIGKKVVKKMKETFGSNPKDCIAAIGPAIGKCCYETDQSVIDQFEENFTNMNQCIVPKGKNKYMLDLWQVNKITLEEIGVLETNITMSNMCTVCNKEKLFSHRGDQGLTGRMAAIMALR